MRRLLTPRWIAVHVAVLVLVAGFLGLGWWQISRAREGNLLSFGYAVEWPVFAGFVIWFWIVEMRKVRGQQPGPQEQDVRSGEPAPTRPRRPRDERAYDDSDDPALHAYNHYLAWLSANPRRSPAAYPGLPDPAPATKENP